MNEPLTTSHALGRAAILALELRGARGEYTRDEAAQIVGRLIAEAVDAETDACARVADATAASWHRHAVVSPVASAIATLATDLSHQIRQRAASRRGASPDAP